MSTANDKVGRFFRRHGVCRVFGPTPTPSFPVKTHRICINPRNDLWQKNLLTLLYFTYFTYLLTKVGWSGVDKGHVHPSTPRGDAPVSGYLLATNRQLRHD